MVTMKMIFFPLLIASTLSLAAQNAIPLAKKAIEAPANEIKATDFIRVDRNDQAVRLQTGITRYKKDGVVVDLIGAVHIADAKYFKQLNTEFTHYESVLFEMVGGNDPMVEKNAKENQDAKTKDPMMDMLGNVYGMVSNFLNLQGQKDGIDYTAKNLVHADLSMEEFNKIQSQKGESLIGFALKNAQQAQKKATDHGDGKGDVNAPDPNKLLMALLSGDANKLKLEIVGTLGQGDDQVAAFAGNSVIIGDRNAKCLKVLDQQIKAGDKKIGIFYGAAHFPDMEKRLLKMGYQQTTHRWLTAWDMKVGF